jgi:hypothetical protein
MPENRNSHVDRLNRFLPFSPSHDQIFEEFQKSGDSLDLDTRALSYTMDAIRDGARLIVLTGDAGHGKTHLCRRILQELLGYDENEARVLINEQCDGRHVIRLRDVVSGSPALRVFKDFSELPVEIAADSLEAAIEDDRAVTVLCANEGRLRAVLESVKAGQACRGILDDFRETFRDGLASRDGRIHIVNMNFQSVAAGSYGESLVGRAIHDWTSGTRWSACRDCSSRSGCPLHHNRMMLATQGGDGRSETRRQRIVEIFATLERLGAVVTIRDMLMIIAYMLTSGLRCPEVHARYRKEGVGWQHQHAFYNLLFERPGNLSAERLGRIPLLSDISRFDPGRFARRSIDEQIINDQHLFPENEPDLQFLNRLERDGIVIDAANGIDEVLGNPRNRKERHAEAEFVQAVVRSLRRRAFFDDDSTSSQAALERMGFGEGGAFLDILDAEAPKGRLVRLKRQIIAGLHTIQGLQLGTSENELYLVDPAFGSATSRAAIIADTVPAGHILLIPLSEKWVTDEGDPRWLLPKTVDWIDRHVVLRITDDSGASHDLSLDLMIFDCIVRAAGGYVAEQFYAHDIRRIGSFLGQLAETRKRTDDRIMLFIEGRRHSVSLDEDFIQVGGAG